MRTQRNQGNLVDIWKSITHKKQKYPKKGKFVENQEPTLKRSRGRPRQEASPTASQSQSPRPSHHDLSTNPSAIGRGGRRIHTGQGSRGGSVIGSRSKGRGCQVSGNSVTTTEIVSQLMIEHKYEYFYII